MKLNVNFVLFILIVVAAKVSAADKADGDLLKVLAKERKEISNIFQQENAELRRDDQKLRERDEKLHDRIDKLTEQIGKQNEQINVLQVRNKEPEEQINKLHRKPQRQADSEVNPQNGTLKSNHENETSVFEEKLRNSTELKKIVKSEIKIYLINERICVTGYFSGAEPTSETIRRRVKYGYSFPRKPVVSVALSYFGDYYFDPGFNWGKANAQVTDVTNSAAEITVYVRQRRFTIHWMACL